MNNQQLINLICTCIGLAMGVAVVVLNILNKLNVENAVTMLGIGLFAISLTMLKKNKK